MTRLLNTQTLVRRALVAAVLMSFPAATLSAQDPRAATTKAATDAMARFAWLEGQWEGPATVQNAGRTFTLTQREAVKMAARGTALMIEGRGSMRMAPDQPEREVFGAAGILTYDANSSRYRFFSASGSGNGGESKAELTGENGLIWSFGDAQNRTRYTITRTAAGAWYELGEHSSDDGKTWVKIMEMTLTKKP